MTAEFIGRFTTGSPEWHQARAGALGGSEVAAAIGLSPFESPFSLWHRKAGLIGPTEDNGEMYWGRRLEGPIRDEFERRHLAEYDPMIRVGTWRHAERTYQVANPDALLFAPSPDPQDVPLAILECKAARIRDAWGAAGTDEIPVYYRAQVLWYMDVFGVKTAHLAVLFAGSEYAEFTVEFDEMEAAILRERGRLFVQSLVDGIRPDIDSHVKTYDTIRKLAPGIEDYDVELDADIALPYLKAIQAHAAAEDAKRQATARVLDAVGAGRRARWLDEPIARRQRKGDAPPFLVYIPAKPERQVISA